MKKRKDIPKGYKETAVGVIPEDWNVKSLGEIAKIKRGRFSPRPRNDPKFYGGNIPFVQTSDVALSEGRINTYSQTLNEHGLKVSVLFPKGTILITIAANIGHTAILDTDMACPDSLVGIMVHKETNNEYLNYYLRFIQKRIEYIAPGAQKNINIDFLFPLEVIAPEIKEQTSIANLLSTWDRSIQTITKQIDQKQLRKKWLMQQLLTGKKRLKGFEKEKWEEVTLDHFFAERNETNFIKLSLLSIGQNGVYPQDESLKKDTSNEDKSKYKRICPGDIGYNTMRMWQGRSALSSLEGIVSPAYTVIIPKQNADSLFFSYLFKTPKLMNLFWRNSQGLVDDTLNCKFKDFSIVKVHLPLFKKEQSAIALILKTADKEIEIFNTRLEKLKEQKKGLMQVLLTGKKRLKIK